MVTVEQLNTITGTKRNRENKLIFSRFLSKHSSMPAYELAQFLAQILHESGGLKHAREIWGPTRAQKGYEGRRDLGNVQAGDGKRFMGRDFIQITGRANYRALSKWAMARNKFFPDFEANPEALEKPQHLGIGALWYWTTRIPRVFITEGNIEMITRRVNGGLNGFADRLRYYDRSALVLLGYPPDGVESFQRDMKIGVDGISGPITRAKMHEQLKLKSVQKRPSAGWLARLIALFLGGNRNG